MDNQKNKIEEIKKYREKFYNSHAKNYDLKNYQDKDFLDEFRGFKQIVQIKPQDVVLDIATGTGTYLIEMVKDKANCYGIDQSKKMLSRLRNKVKHLGLKKYVKKINIGVADSLPYPDDFFDWVTCIGMLEYYPLEYSNVVLTEIFRVLKHAGHCFIDIADPNKTYAQERDWIFSYDLEVFDHQLKSLGFNIKTKNKAGYMLQYLIIKKRDVFR